MQEYVPWRMLVWSYDLDAFINESQWKEENNFAVLQCHLESCGTETSSKWEKVNLLIQSAFEITASYVYRATGKLWF